LSILGVALSALGVYLHEQISSSHGEYASFCDVSAEVSCDAILGSSYAVFLGTSVATWGLVGWLGALGLSVWVFLAKGRETIARATYLLAAAGSILAISLYFLVVSVFVIEVICPVCISLDATALGLLAVAAAQVKLLVRSAPKSWQPRPVLVTAAFATVVVLLGLYLGQESTPHLRTGPISIAEVRENDPRFYAYYISQKAVDAPLPEGVGPDDAAIVVVEFSDFQCPYCRRAFFDLEAAVAAEPGDVQVFHRNFPLNADCNPEVSSRHHAVACEAARASECAHEAGKGHAYNRALFANQSSLDADSFGALASQVGLDASKLEACMASPASKEKVAVDLAAGKAAGVASTPTIYINGRVIKGALTPEQFRYAFAIERDLKERGDGR
jgi:protein-disulfide isomerase